MAALGHLTFLQGRLALQALAAGALEAVVVAAIGDQLEVFQVHDPFGDPVQQVAVVGDQQQGAGIGSEVAFEPERRLQVEMIGRLVQQQEIGLGKQQRRQGDAHAPAARELAAVALLRGLVEPETGQDTRRSGRRAGGADVGQALVDFGDPCGLARRFGLFEQGRALRIGGENRVEQALRPGRRVLCDQAEPHVALQGEAAFVGLQAAGDQLEQSRLAAAVGADQPGTLALVDGDRGPLEQGAAGDPVSHLVDMQHGGPGDSTPEGAGKSPQADCRLLPKRL